MNAPCKNCLTRRQGCHGGCSKYAEYEAYNAEQREARLQQHRSMSDLSASRLPVRKHCERMKRH